MTALTGKVMTAAAIAFLIAVAAKAAFWPFAVFVVPAGSVSSLAGYVIYPQDGNGRDDGTDAEPANTPIRVKPGPCPSFTSAARLVPQDGPTRPRT